MELRQLWKIVLRWWWLIVLPPLVVGAYGLATYRPPATVYATSLRFTAGQPAALAASPNYDPNYYRWLTSEYIVNALKEWVRTGKFAEAVSIELTKKGVNLPAGAVAGALAADNARSLLVVYVTWGNPDQLSALADSVTAVLREQNAAVFPQLGGLAAEVVSLDTGGIGPVPPSLRARLDLPLKVGLGLVTGVALALVAHYLDPFVRDKDELEAMGWIVMAEIPKGRR